MEWEEAGAGETILGSRATGWVREVRVGGRLGVEVREWPPVSFWRFSFDLDLLFFAFPSLRQARN